MIARVTALSNGEYTDYDPKLDNGRHMISDALTLLNGLCIDFKVEYIDNEVKDR